MEFLKTEQEKVSVSRKLNWNSTDEFNGKQFRESEKKKLKISSIQLIIHLFCISVSVQ